MALSERGRSSESEKKRRPDLLRYSHNLSNAILAETDGSVGKEIRPDILNAFQRGSISDRDSYWQEKRNEQNFGTQMLSWMGRGEQPGISQWVAKQSDTDVAAVLQEVGLKSDPVQTKKDLQSENVVTLLATINTDLAKAGKSPLAPDSLSEEEARSLIFYANYLTGEKGTQDTKSFIDTVVGVAERRSNGNADETIAKLQKVAPLLNIAGEEAQFALGALMVAKAHAETSHEAVQNASGDLNNDEEHIVEFIKRHIKGNELDPNKTYNVEKVFKGLKPEPTPGHPYWIAKEISGDFAKKLSKEELQSLEQTKPLFEPFTDEFGEERWDISRAVFAPAHDLEKNLRFKNAEALTQGDSGLFALAAASVETPEKQAALYRQLGETVLRVHEENPKLLEEFLKVQSEGSSYFIAQFDTGRSQEQLQKALVAAQGKVQEEIQKRLPGVDLTNKEALSHLTEEQGKVLQEALFSVQLPVMQDVLHSLDGRPGRLVALDVALSDEYGLEEKVNIPDTIAAWPERVKHLQEALQKNPLTLTPDQIRQIEFLSHSVNTVAVMEWLQGSLPVGQIPQPIESSPEQSASSESQPETEPARETLKEFFADINQSESDIPEHIKPRREDMKIADSTHMAEFSTSTEEVSKFEIANDGEFAIFAMDENPSGQTELSYNTHNPFLNRLVEKDTISEYSLQNLFAKGVGPNTLLPYVLEAGGDAEQKEILFRNLFLQTAKIYEEHPEISDAMKAYLTKLSEQSPFMAKEEENSHANRLFSTPEQTQQRLVTLSELLRTNGELTKQDVIDIGVLALPFDLQYLAGRMNEAYRIRTAGSSFSDSEKES